MRAARPLETIPSLIKLLRTVWERLGIESNHIERATRELAKGCMGDYRYAMQVLSELSEFIGHLAFANQDDIRWIMAHIRSPEHLSRCWEQYRRGEVPDDPVSCCAIPSIMDPSLAPDGRYTCTIFSHYFPCDIPRERHKDLANLMAERVIDQIARYAPNFRGAIMDKAVLTQEYFKTTFGVTAGDFSSGLLHPGQIWDRRPVPGWANYRTPLANLYMCGSACHPGPGITCVPGYNGTHAVLEDMASTSSAAKGAVA